MSRIPRFVCVSTLGLTLCALALAGCGEPSDEARFKAATEALSGARAEVAEAQAAVDEKQAVVDEAAAELAEAEEALAGAEARLAEAEGRVDLSATDAVLFRAVQTRLLADEDLRKVAIGAQVKDGVVVLTGEVTDAELRNRAVEITQNTGGVARVESRIEVLAAEGEPEE